MKILFCNYEYPPIGGGGGVINKLLAEELAISHDISVMTSKGFDLPEESIENGVRVFRVPVLRRTAKSVASFISMFSFLPSAVSVGRKLLAKEKFDLINTHFVLPTGPAGDYLAGFAGIPNVLSLHGGDLYDPSKLTSPHRHLPLRIWIKSLLRKADVIVGQSNNTIVNMKSLYTPELDAECIPLGIKRPELAPVSRKKLGLPENTTLLVTIGRIVARKGLNQLIDLMDRIRQMNVHLLVIGTGPLEASLKAEVEKKELGKKITFLGGVEESEKFEILSASDIYVSTSQHEGFGIVFLEAMASAIPVVCYDHGGQSDFLQDGRTGYLVKLNDLETFEERCRELTTNPVKCKMMGEENLKLVEKYYIDNCAKRYEAVFANLVDRSR